MKEVVAQGGIDVVLAKSESVAEVNFKVEFL